MSSEILEHGVRAPVPPVEDVDARDRRRVDAGDVLLLAERLPAVSAHPDGFCAGHGRDRRIGRGLERSEAVVGDDDEVGADLIADRLADGIPQPRREHRDEGDQRQPDHEGRGRRGGAARIPDRVLLCEPAGRTAKATSRPADDASERLDDVGRDQRHADEEDQAADPQRAEALANADPVDERSVDEQEDSEDHGDRRDERRELREP